MMYLLALFPILSLLTTTPILASAPFKSLVTFGDSYTDTVLTGDGGTAWPVYAASYANLSLHPYARAGATCSNVITPMPWASIMEWELPLYFLETHNGSVVLDPEETLYTEWIGTNDLGVDSIFTGSNDGSVVDVVGCMVDWVRVLYADGARFFMVQNVSRHGSLMVILYPFDADDPSRLDGPLLPQLVPEPNLHLTA